MQRVADRPLVGVFRLAFEQAPLHDPVAEEVELDLHVLGRDHRRRLPSFLSM